MEKDIKYILLHIVQIVYFMSVCVRKEDASEKTERK